MPENEAIKYQRGLIITDDIAVDPILDFELYRNAIVNIIKNSYPKFTIGIFGDWGTGKTTLMKSIEKEFKKDKEDKKSIISVWFDAWKYENEKEFALIPLLKTINYSIKEDNNEKKKKLKEALTEAAIFIGGISNNLISSIVTTYAGKEFGGLFKKSLEDITSKLIPQLRELKKLSDADEDSIFYNGIKNIQEALDSIRKDNEDTRVIIFIDDLDRCSEDKVLEILESIKIFLSLDGIIYVLGISHERVIELINKKYQTNNGENYLKKIIQIPITLPKWINDDIIELVKDFIEKGLINVKYKDIFDQKNTDLISEAIENNPREIKRFLNNFILAFEIFHKKTNFNPNELLMIQVIQLRWNNFYNILISSPNDFRNNLLSEINKYTQFDEATRLKVLESNEEKVDGLSFDIGLRKLLSNYKNDLELWKVLGKNFDSLNNIQDWNIYRRATEVSKEPTVIHKRSKIFIAYSRSDAGDFAKYVYDYLHDFGYNVFTDISSIQVGEIWSNTIAENISKCDIFVVIVTYGSLNSPHVEKEVLQAQKEMKIIIPCFHRLVKYNDIKWGLTNIQGIEFDNGDELARILYSKMFNYA